jgi:hypothetical protein
MCDSFNNTYLDLRNAWRDMLNATNRDYFVTLTFRANIYVPSYCAYTFREWMNRWEEQTAIERDLAHWGTVCPNTGKAHIRGPWANSRKQGRRSALPTWFVAIEPHQKGDLHMHSLLRCSEQLPNLDPEAGTRIWSGSSRDGGMNMGLIDIQIPRSSLGVQDYITKDVMFKGHVEFSKNFISG